MDDRRHGPTDLSSLLEAVVQSLGVERELDDYRIWEAWNEVVGEQVANRAQPLKLDGKKLIVGVTSSAWLQELTLLRRDLSGRLNEWMERSVIEEVVFVLNKNAVETNRHIDSIQHKRAQNETGAVDQLWDKARSRPSKESK